MCILYNDAFVKLCSHATYWLPSVNMHSQKAEKFLMDIISLWKVVLCNLFIIFFICNLFLFSKYFLNFRRKRKKNKKQTKDPCDEYDDSSSNNVSHSLNINYLTQMLYENQVNLWRHSANQHYPCISPPYTNVN